MQKKKKKKKGADVVTWGIVYENQLFDILFWFWFFFNR